MNNQQYDEQQPRRHIPALKIIGTVLLVMVLICGGLVTYAVYQFPRWASALARGPLVSVIDQTGLPDSQKVSIKQNVARVADAFQDGRMSYTQFKAILQDLHNGPFFQLIMIEALRHQYTIAHPVMDEERNNTMLALDRFQRGIVEKLIPQRAVADVLALIPDPDQDKPGRKTDTMDEADLKPAIDAIKSAVQAAAIPAEPFVPDFAEEVDRVVSAVLRSPTTQPAQTQPSTTKPTGSAPAKTLTDNTQASQMALRPVNLIIVITLINNGASRA